MLHTLFSTTWGRWRLDWGQRTHVMGIINMTPDSFSGDGILRGGPEQNQAQARVLEQASAFVDEGATLIDVGGESTRPNFTPLPLEEELRRVIPVITLLARHLPPEVI